MSLAAKNDLDRAISEFRRTVELNPNEPHTRAFLGFALAQQRDLNGAMEQFRGAIQTNPNDGDAHAGLGVVLNALNDTFGGITELKRSLELQPDSPMALYGLAWIYVTAEDPRFRNPAEGLALARRAVASSPAPDPAIIDTLAEALLVNGYPDEALATEMQAVRLSPEFESRLARFREAARAQAVKDR